MPLWHDHAAKDQSGKDEDVQDEVKAHALHKIDVVLDTRGSGVDARGGFCGWQTSLGARSQESLSGRRPGQRRGNPG